MKELKKGILLLADQIKGKKEGILFWMYQIRKVKKEIILLAV